MIDEVEAVLGDEDSAAVASWWPSVHLTVTEVERGGEGGLGRLLDLYITGRLP